jgi:polysaccharide export outer membrane protein
MSKTTLFCHTLAVLAARITRSFPSILSSALLGLIVGLAGCSTSPTFEQVDNSAVAPPPTAVKPETVILREGDSIRVTFPGTPALNGGQAQVIRRDGKINLPLVGDVVAAGKTPLDLEKELAKLYANQLLDNKVVVTVEASSFPVYVSGAVLRPGKILSDHPMTALEAIMEAGGFDETRANEKKVQIIRNNKGHMEHYTLNLKRVIDGEDNTPFYLKPADIVHVPERFQWY